VILSEQISAVEFGFVVFATGLAFIIPARRWKPFLALRNQMARLSSHHLACGLLVAFLPLAIRFSLLPWIPVPHPAIQEEFSNILAADTWAHGRLANPRHPMAVFFDNVQVIQYPKYVSVRFPGIAIFLWLGQAIIHHPWAGVWLAVAAMCAAFYWMLLGWTRPFWALICAVLFGLRFGIFSYWMNSYWPGSPAALGGALVLGATPRLCRRPTALFGFIYALGCVILLLNRPVEGALFIAPTCLAIPWAWRRRPPGLPDMARAIAPVAALAAISIACVLWNNYVTTGCAGVPAYFIWRDGQGIVPVFWWQPLRKAHLIYYSRETWRFFNVFERELYEAVATTWRSRLSTLFWRLVQFPRIDIGLLLLIPMLFPPVRQFRRRRFWLGFYFAAILAAGLGLAPYAQPFAVAAGARDIRVFLECLFAGIYCIALLIAFSGRWGRLRLPLIVLLISLLFRLLTTFSMPVYYPEYFAPTLILIAEGFRRLYCWSRKRGVGAALARNICLGCLAMTAVRAAIPFTGHHVLGEDPFYMNSYENRLEERVRVEKFLDGQPGPQLAIVRYGPKHDELMEWVWNRAEIDTQKVVWARELKPEWTSQLLRYYSSRTAWLVEADERPARITLYRAQAGNSPAEPLPAAKYADIPQPPSCRAPE
jgi:hypothetical protein